MRNPSSFGVDLCLGHLKVVCVHIIWALCLTRVRFVVSFECINGTNGEHSRCDVILAAVFLLVVNHSDSVVVALCLCVAPPVEEDVAAALCCVLPARHQELLQVLACLHALLEVNLLTEAPNELGVAAGGDLGHVHDAERVL